VAPAQDYSGVAVVMNANTLPDIVKADGEQPVFTVGKAGTVSQPEPHLHFLEIFMHKLNRHRALANGGSNALHRPGTYIACGEHPTTAGLQ